MKQNKSFQDKRIERIHENQMKFFDTVVTQIAAEDHSVFETQLYGSNWNEVTIHMRQPGRKIGAANLS